MSRSRLARRVRKLDLENNQHLTTSDEEKALFKQQCASAKLSSAAMKLLLEGGGAALAKVVAVLRAHVGVARVALAENACARL